MELFVGVDVSKSKLDVCVLKPGGESVNLQESNNSAGHKRLISRVARITKGEPAHWCMEATGPYHIELAIAIASIGQLVSVENPRRIKQFGVALGAVQKTDRADAKVIAEFARRLSPSPWKLSDPKMRDLIALDRRITELKQLIVQEQNRLEQPSLPNLIVRGIESSVANFEEQIKLIERQIKELVRSDEALSKSVSLLQTIAGFGFRSAVGLLAEAGDISKYESAEQLAASFGLHPTLKRSGSSVHGRTKISKAGNSHARHRMYMPTIVALTHNPLIREFYERLLSNHKPKKSALLACERKLVMIAYGVLKSQKPFDPAYKT
jgi:transposase